MRNFYLYRKDDESGVSGLGFVAEGTQFPNGKCVLNWRTGMTSVAVYDNSDTLIAIHGHGGKTIIVWDDLDFISEDDGIPHLMDGAHAVNGKTNYSEGSWGPIPKTWKKPSEILSKIKY